MTISRQKSLRLPQTYLLLAGVALGYAALVVVLGSRWIVIAAGALVSVSTLALWSWELSRKQTSANLLDPRVFQDKLAIMEKRLDPKSRSIWDQVQGWAKNSQDFASRMVNRDSGLTGDLLEILYTVVALVEQVSNALQALDQIQTPTYRQQIQQRLQTSCDRLQQTNERLNRWHDQLVLTGLDQASQAITVDLPLQLHSLIDDNKVVLQSWLDSPSHPGG